MAPLSLPLPLSSILKSSTSFANRLEYLKRNTPPPSLPPSPPNIAMRSLQFLSKSTTSLLRRQTIVVIPTTYANQNSGPKPGTVIGIILGSVAGFLLLLWLIYTCFNLGPGARDTTVIEEEIIRRRSRSPRRAPPSRRSSPRRSISRSEVIEVSRHRSPIPPPRSPPRREVRRESIVVEEVRRPSAREDDIVEVIEEHSPPRRQRSHRASGYRTVDPEAFGGGDRPLRPVSGSRR